jgi:hypothetical protein
MIDRSARLPSPEISRSPEHLARWRAALARGCQEAPKCERILSDGRRCGNLPMREGRKLNINLCRLHLRGEDRDKVDAMREPRLLRRAESTNLIKRAKAVRSLASLRRRRTFRLWRRDARIPGSTTPVLSAADAARVEEWLVRHGVHESHRLMTARCRDECIWVAIMALGDRISEAAAQRRLRGIMRREARFWETVDDPV